MLARMYDVINVWKCHYWWYHYDRVLHDHDEFWTNMGTW